MGDLISRNELLNCLAEYGDSDKKTDYDIGWDDACDAIARIVKYAKAVDAEPVMNGSNITYTHPSDMFICTECGFTCEITELRYDDDGMGEPDAYEYDCKFCPNCGEMIERQ